MTDEVLMGVTVEEVEARIDRLRTQGEQAEGFDIKKELNSLRNALTSNPNVVNSLSEEDLGEMVKAFRTIHADAFAAAAAKATPAKKAKGSTQKAIKEASKKSLDDMGLDLDEL